MRHNVRLTESEKRMLDGECGRLKQRALELIVQYADALDAECLCTVTKAHLFVGNFSFMRTVASDDVDIIMSQMYLNTSEEKLILDQVSCYTETDARMMDPDHWAEMGVTQEEKDTDLRYMERFHRAGVHMVNTCGPYLVGFVPLMGEHYVCTESHAIPLMNGIWGACANADSIELSVAAAVCGRTPLWGTHIMKNRRGTHLYRVDCDLPSVFEWDLLGHAIGRTLPPFSIPIIDGNFARPDLDRLRSMCASMSTTSGAEMMHVVGVTPEAFTMDLALSGKMPEEEVVITQRDLDKSRAFLCAESRAPIHFVSLGCPHYSLEQLKLTAFFLKDRKIAGDVVLQIWTALPVKEMGIKSGWVQTIEEAGGIVLTSSCPLASGKWPLHAEGMAFDSCKQAHYMQSETRTAVFTGSMEQCLNAAVTGRWERDRA